jgi:hypothetical protein
MKRYRRTATHPRGESLQRAVKLLKESGPMLAGGLGLELWGKRPCLRVENTAATMYCRAAGRLLKRAKEMGLVYDEQRGPQRLWYAVGGRT